jgi:hypothetical protein
MERRRRRDAHTVAVVGRRYACQVHQSDGRWRRWPERPPRVSDCVNVSGSSSGFVILAVFAFLLFPNDTLIECAL